MVLIAHFAHEKFIEFNFISEDKWKGINLTLGDEKWQKVQCFQMSNCNFILFNSMIFIRDCEPYRKLVHQNLIFSLFSFSKKINTDCKEHFEVDLDKCLKITRSEGNEDN